MDLIALTDFNLVATHGGFGRASRASSRAKATLSRHVLELEQALGVRLFERGARFMRLTDQGRTLHDRTKGLLNEIGLVAEAVSGEQIEPHGLLRLSAPLMFSHVHLGRIAAGFVAAYPQVLLEASVDNRLVDLVKEGYDLVIRANPQPTDDLVGRCFLRDKMLIVAPPSLPQFAAGAVDPSIPAVSFAGADDTIWNYRSGDETRRIVPRPVLRLASMIMVRDAVIAGAGAALLPASMVQAELKAGSLTCWAESAEPQVEIWILHTSRRLVSGKIRAFSDFIAGSFP